MLESLYVTINNWQLSITASALKEEADSLAARYNNVESHLLDIEEREDILSELIQDSDVVVSLLPYALHPKVCKMCIANKVSVSYT